MIVGFAPKIKTRRHLFVYEDIKSDPVEIAVDSINAYLSQGSQSIFVKESATALSAKNDICFGNMPADNGNLIIEKVDMDVFNSYQSLRPYIKNLVGAKELLHCLPRFCLWLVGAPQEVLDIPLVKQRIDACRLVREKGSQKKLADTPHLFRDLNNPPTAIVVPRVTSERREYIPMNFIGNDTIVSDACHMIPNGTLYDFGILESRMHMTWMRTVCGRLKSDYRYSRDLCYNTFPWPDATEPQKKVIENLANNILMIREFYPDMTLADLYDPDKMPDDLRKAHQELDIAVDKLYRRKASHNDEQRQKHLFGRYAKLVKGEDSSALFHEE